MMAEDVSGDTRPTSSLFVVTTTAVRDLVKVVESVQNTHQTGLPVRERGRPRGDEGTQVDRSRLSTTRQDYWSLYCLSLRVPKDTSHRTCVHREKTVSGSQGV